MNRTEDKLPVVIIACAVFKGVLESIAVDGTSRKIQFLDYGLHLVPSDLRATLQKAIDSIRDPSLVVLGYGLCGNGLDGLKSGIHTLLIPRADDCIALFLGSYRAYRREFDAHPGTYYLTKGWLESGSDPLHEYERMVERYGQETADWLMDQQYRNYTRLVLVASNQEDLESYSARAQEVAEYCAQWGMKYEEILGSDAFLQSLADSMASYPQVEEEILAIPPGRKIERTQFVRS